MVFNSIDFFWFMALLIPLYYFAPHRSRWMLLLTGSYVFYAQWSVQFALVLLLSTLMNYLAGSWIDRAPAGRLRNTTLVGALTANLLLLSIFMYAGFLLQMANGLFSWSGRGPTWAIDAVPLPLGISFYTFHAISYLLDIYWGRQRPETHLGFFALYIAFFPKLLAGPIERSGHLIPQFKAEKHFSLSTFESGFRLMMIGLFKKMVLADRLAVLVNTVYGDVYHYNGTELALATLFFTFQIYLDFSGYTDIAIGVARIFGFDLTPNFNRPYLARSITEFWKKWHITLTAWFREYVYIPLGGSRRGKGRTALNLLLVFLISGLWHGAAPTFILWGFLNGLYILIERFWLNAVYQAMERRYPGSVGIGVLRTGFTFMLVGFSWIFFRASRLSEAFYVARSILSMGEPAAIYSLGLDAREFWVAVVLTTLLMLYEYGRSLQPESHLARVEPWAVRLAANCGLILVIIILGVYGAYDKTQFIYFDF